MGEKEIEKCVERVLYGIIFERSLPISRTVNIGMIYEFDCIKYEVSKFFQKEGVGDGDPIRIKLLGTEGKCCVGKLCRNVSRSEIKT